MLGGQPGEQVGSEPHQEGLSKGREPALAGVLPSVAQPGAKRHTKAITPRRIFICDFNWFSLVDLSCLVPLATILPPPPKNFWAPETGAGNVSRGPLTLKNYHDFQEKVINNRQAPPDRPSYRFRVIISREATEWRAVT